MLNSLMCPVGLILLAAAAVPCPQEKHKRVKVTMVVILAAEEGDKIDKRLKMIAQEIRNQNPNLKSFKLVSMGHKKLAVDEKSVFNLVENQTAQVIVKHPADKENKVGLAVTAPDQGEIVYHSACGKFLPIVTRYHTKSKERLILAVRVEPCNGN